MIRIKRKSSFTLATNPSGNCKLLDETLKIKSLYNSNRIGFSNGKVKFNFYSSIYGHTDILKELFVGTQFKKCCYCEKKEYRDTTTVDHFRPKKGYKQAKKSAIIKPGYYWLAYTWGNLLYACNTCNRNKGNLFPLRNEIKRVKNHRQRDHICINEEPMIINPFKENPEHYFKFNAALISAKLIRDTYRLNKAKTTIDCLSLNRNKLVDDRLELYHTVQTYINRKLGGAKSTVARAAAINQVKKYLKDKASKKHPFSLMIKSNFRKYI